MNGSITKELWNQMKAPKELILIKAHEIEEILSLISVEIGESAGVKLH